MPVYDSGSFHGVFGWNWFIDDLDGDGDKDYVFFYDNGNGTWNVSAFDLGARRFLWPSNWTTPISVNNFGAVDLTGDGIKEIYWEGTSWLYILYGNNGTVAWSHKVNWFFGRRRWRRPCGGSHPLHHRVLDLLLRVPQRLDG
jgi:hypothetical protein